MLNKYRNENTEILHRVTFPSICPDLSVSCAEQSWYSNSQHFITLWHTYKFPDFLCCPVRESKSVKSSSDDSRKHYQLAVTWKGRSLRKDGPLSLTMWPGHIQLRISQEFVRLSKGRGRNWVLSGRKVQSALAVTTQFTIISAMGKV